MISMCLIMKVEAFPFLMTVSAKQSAVQVKKHRLITTIPWGHNQRIIFKCKDVREAVFYAQYTLGNNWSRDVLEHQIESGLYERKGKAITNFKDKLPANASDLAIQTLKDPYSFDFLTTRSFFCKKH